MILCMALIDLIAKYLNSKICMRECRAYYIIGIGRVIIVPQIICGYYFSNLPFFENIAFGSCVIILEFVTNGFITSASTAIISEKGNKNVKKDSGYIMIISLFLGLTFGSVWPMQILMSS